MGWIGGKGGTWSLRWIAKNDGWGVFVLVMIGKIELEGNNEALSNQMGLFHRHPRSL